MEDFSLELHNATIDDIDKVVFLENQLFVYDAWINNMFKNILNYKNHSFVVAKVSDNIVGYICTQYILDEMAIDNLAVDAAWQGRGVASALLNNQISKAQNIGIRHIFLEVATNNTAALKLYEKFGFKALRLRKNYYTYSDALELRLDL